VLICEARVKEGGRANQSSAAARVKQTRRRRGTAARTRGKATRRERAAAAATGRRAGKRAGGRALTVEVPAEHLSARRKDEEEDEGEGEEHAVPEGRRKVEALSERGQHRGDGPIHATTDECADCARDARADGHALVDSAEARHLRVQRVGSSLFSIPLLTSSVALSHSLLLLALHLSQIPLHFAHVAEDFLRGLKLDCQSRTAV